MAISCLMPHHKTWCRQKPEHEYGEPYGPCARSSLIRKLTGKQLSHSENDIVQEPRKFWVQPPELTRSTRNGVLL